MADPADKIPNLENSEGDEASDRRSYFRVRDEVELEIQVSSAEEEDSTSDDVNDLAFSNDSLYHTFLKAVRALDLNDAQIAFDLKKDDAELYRYLQTINRKIELLARLILNAEIPPTQEADLSPGGVGLVSSESFEPGDVVKVRIIFPKSYDVVYAFGHVIYCEDFVDDTGEKKYRVGLQFTKISETNKRIMTRQVFKKQSDDLREARQQSESSQGQGEQGAAEPEEDDAE